MYQLISEVTMQTSTDCRSSEGVTVGLIDSFITISRVLKGRDLTADSVVEALKDLASDEDFAYLLSAIDKLK